MRSHGSVVRLQARYYHTGQAEGGDFLRDPQSRLLAVESLTSKAA